MSTRPLRALLGASWFLAMSGSAWAAQPTVVIFMIDGLQPGPARVAADNGAANIKFFIDNGVTVNEALCNNPWFYPLLPNGSQPWGTASPPNVAMHTGTHVYESRQMDDIFLSAARSGISSVFAGGAGNYDVFTTATYLHVSGSMSDAQVVDHGINRLTQNGVRLIRLHPQRIRDAWTGPSASTNPSSAYQAAIRSVDGHLGRLVTTLKNRGLWEDTYVILGSDHGMGNTSGSGHPANVRSSWQPFLCFYGPGLKRGATIPYAETSDIAIMAAHFLGIEKPRGHTDPNVNINPKTTTATFLSNLFVGAPDTLAHPQFIRRYLTARNNTPPDNYTDYRSYMLSVIGQTPRPTPTATPTPTPTGAPTATPTPCPGCTFVEITPPASAVTASTNDGNLPGNTVDNLLSTRWSGNGDGAWIRFDLGSPRIVAQVKVAVYNGNGRRNRFDIQASNDGTSWADVSMGLESSGTTTLEETYDVDDVSARYIRYLGHMSTIGTFNSVTEISIIGLGGPPPTATITPTPTPTGEPTATPPPTATPTPTPVPSLVEVPLSASAVTASSHDGNLPGNTVDGSLSTRWSASGDGQWIRFDLGTPRTIGHVTVGVYQGNARRARFDIQLSDDGNTWRTAFAGESSGTTTAEQVYEFPDDTAQYVRYLGHGNTVNAWNSVLEVSVFAVP